MIYTFQEIYIFFSYLFTSFNFLCSENPYKIKNLLHVALDGLDKKLNQLKHVTCLQQFNQVVRFNFYLISYTINAYEKKISEQFISL